MVPLRFIFFSLIFLLQHLRGSSAQTLQDMKKSVASPGSKLEKVVYDGVPTGTEIEITGLGGRKMMFTGGMVKVEVLNREDAISGNDIYARKKQPAGNSREDVKDYQQDDRSILKAKSLNSARLESVYLPRKGQLNSQYSKLVSSSTLKSLGCSSASSGKLPLQESGDLFQNLESRKLLDAGSELMQLTSKDYGGHGGPRHNPPINNNEPLNSEEHMIP